MSPDRDNREPDGSHLKAPLGTYRPAGEATEKQRHSSEPERSKFAMILNEMDERSRKSNQWLSGVSFIYVAVVALLVAILYLRYSEVGKLADQLEQHFADTSEAIAEQATLHREQSKEITNRIASADVILDGMGKDWESLDSQLDDGKEKADELLRESDNLQTKIAEIDRLLARLSKRAEPFYVHYAIDPDKPQKFGRGKVLGITFDEIQTDPLFAPSDNVERKGQFYVPASGTYLVTGWFATGDGEDPPNGKYVIETEIRVDGAPIWSGLSYGNGNFTAGVPLRRGQALSVHATVRSSDEAEPPSDSIERGEIRIARLYYTPD